MKKRLMALLLSGVLAVSMFAGCGSEIDKAAIVATDGTTDITLGVANFMARLTQSQYDDFYVSYFGENVWRTDMYGYGTTAEDDMKATVINNLYAMYALKNHMADYGVEISTEELEAISAAADAFISSNSAEAIKALGADKDIVEAYLELLAIQDKMYDEIVKAADTNVSDAEASTSAYSQVYISKTSYTDAEGKSVEYTAEEKEALAQTVKAFAETAKTTGLKEAATSYGYTATTATYNEKSTVSTEIKTALDALTEDGAVSDLIETDSAYYVLQMDAVVDADATEATRESIISERQTALYTDVVDGYVAETEWKLNERLWAKVTFNNLFTLYALETETEELAATEE